MVACESFDSSWKSDHYHIERHTTLYLLLAIKSVCILACYLQCNSGIDTAEVRIFHLYDYKAAFARWLQKGSTMIICIIQANLSDWFRLARRLLYMRRFLHSSLTSRKSGKSPCAVD